MSSSKQFRRIISFLAILSPVITVSSFHARTMPIIRSDMIQSSSSSSSSSSSTLHSRPNLLRLYSSAEPDMTTLKSDVFEDPTNNKRGSNGNDLLDELVGFLPPPPEDQFIMTGDIAVLFLYSFFGHAVDDYVVNSVFSTSQTTEKAIHTLDPLQEVVRMQTPVWMDYSTAPNVLDQVISMNAKDTLLQQWGPLFSSPGVCTVALCSTWLLAGYLHRAFSFDNSIDCEIPKTLQKTLETWITMMVMMLGLTFGSNALVEHTPILQTILGCHCVDFLLTKDDALFLVDTASILISWRFTANVMCQFLR